MKKILGVAILAMLLMTGCQQAPNSVDAAEGDASIDMESNVVAGVVLSEFEAKDLNDNPVKATIFKESKITVLNLWGTFCGPCIDEMPELEAVSNAYDKKDVQVIGLLVDPENKGEALEIVEKLAITYKNLLAEDDLKTSISDKFDYVPVTLFVDENGTVLERYIPGSTTKEDLEAILKTLVTNE